MDRPPDHVAPRLAPGGIVAAMWADDGRELLRQLIPVDIESKVEEYAEAAWIYAEKIGARQALIGLYDGDDGHLMAWLAT